MLTKWSFYNVKAARASFRLPESGGGGSISEPEPAALDGSLPAADASVEVGLSPAVSPRQNKAPGGANCSINANFSRFFD